MWYVLDHGMRVILTVAPVAIIAFCLARVLVREVDTAKRLAAGLLIAFAVVIAASALLGMLGVLSFSGYVVALWPPAAAALLVSRKYGSRETRSPDEQAKPSWPVTALGIVATTITIGALATKLLYGMPEYDELTYHLFFPNQWVAHQRVFLIDTPFGDAAPGYAPANGELWYGWLMAPMAGPAPGQDGGGPPEFRTRGVIVFHVLFHGGIGFLAKIGQFPFLLLLGSSLTLLARRLGAKAPMKYLPAVLLPFIPWVLRQASSASVDLMMGSLLVAALAFGCEHRSTGKRIDAVASGLSLGLACGVKFVALVYMPFVLLPALIGFFEKRDGKALLGFSLAAALAGTPWYWRNVFLTGNPIFPADVSFFGHVIFPGAYTRQAMAASPFHVPDVGSAVAVAAHSVGFWFSVLCLGGMISGLVLCRRRPEWRLVAWIAPVALLWHFLVVPYNSQDRFLLWIGALSLLPLALWPNTGKCRLSLGLLLLALVGFSLVGPRVSLQLGTVRVPAAGLLVAGIPNLLETVLVTLVVCLAWYVGRSRAWAGVVVGAAALAIMSALVRPVMFVRPMNANVPPQLPLAGYHRLLQEHPKTVAYAGRNIPYFLAGAEGGTRVCYVNVDGQTDEHLYGYVRDAAASGQLDKTDADPDWARRNPNFDAWRAAMARLGVGYLFVEPLSPSEAKYIGNDTEGFPVERAWARGHPEAFTLVASDRKWEIYSVLPLRR
jgi:hypothetical protein